MNNAEHNATRRAFRRKMGLDLFRAVLGNSTNGQLQPDPLNNPGSYYVEYITGNGMSLPTILRMGPQFVGQIRLGAGVICKYDENDELVIWGNDVKAQIAKGFNPTYNNPADTSTTKTVDTANIVALATHPTSPVSKNVIIRSFLYYRGSIAHLFKADEPVAGVPKGKVDLTSYIPSAGEWCLAGVFLKPDDTLEVVASTAKTMLTALDLTDIQECLTAATTSSIPAAFYKLQDDQATITDADIWIEARQYVNIPRYGRTATVISYAMIETDNIVAVTDTTAIRTITLPAASSVTPGWLYIVQDEYGTAGTNNITISKAGSDTVNGGASVAISANYGRKTLYSDGVSKWFSA